MLIVKILIFIIFIMIYVYSGLRLVETIKNESLYIYFWMAYIFFGITLINIVLLSKYWGKLSIKTAPPGPRGPRGDDGNIGNIGACNMDSNIIYAQKEIKSSIAQLIKSQYDNLAIDDVYTEETLQLKNNYLDYKIKLMLTSKQFETVLLTPSDDNNPNKKSDKTKVYGKSIEDLSKYLTSIWQEWINGIIEVDKNNARTLFITNDAQIDISPVIEQYFNEEIMKYDVWYWGSTRVFRPLQAEICRSEYSDTKGNKYANTRYPINNRPKLEIKHLEFKQSEIEKYCVKLLDLNIDRTTNDMTKYDVEFKNKYDILSKYKNPVFYLPNVITTSYKQKFYPIGCIIVDKNDDSNRTIKTLLVSGDIIIPNSYEEIWNNEIKIKDDFKCNYEYKRKRGLRRTENKKSSIDTNKTYNRYLSNNLINKNKNYKIENESIDNVNLPENKNDNNIMLKFKTDVDEYIVLGDLPSKIMYISDKKIPTTVHAIGFNDDETKRRKNYRGIVAVPKNFLNEISEYDVEWSFRHKDLLKKSFTQNNYKNIPKPPGSSKYNKNYRTTYKKLNRKIVSSNSIDILKDKTHNIIKIKTDENLPKFYNFKPEIINPTVYPIKEFDKKYEDLGFGWFGYPLKKYRKYSIFAYLGLMPEGIIVHKLSGRKFYIKHYGGVNPNKFIIYLWNEKTQDFTNCVTVRNNSQCFIGKAKNTDPRCQFKVILDTETPNYFRLEPIEYSNKYLKFDFDVNENANLQKNNKNTADNSLEIKRPKGINLDHTDIYITLISTKGNISNSPTIFFNQPATGTNMQILNENMPRNIDRSKSINEQYKQQQILDRANKNSYQYLYNNYNVVELEPNNLSFHPNSKLKYTT